jgi:malate dehydrogenase (oxaloacetate-decarboxylating)(NADP+)
MPNAEILADIAVEAAGVARRFGYEPRIALLAFSTFGHPPGERSAHVQGAVRILDQRRVDFEYDGTWRPHSCQEPPSAGLGRMAGVDPNWT